MVGLAFCLLLAGVVADIRGFDRTRGGYEPPFEGLSGEPIDWTTVETTAAGMLRHGWVIDFLADCTTGMISARIAGVVIPFRPFSERAIAVHKPHAALRPPDGRPVRNRLAYHRRPDGP